MCGGPAGCSGDWPVLPTDLLPPHRAGPSRASAQKAAFPRTSRLRVQRRPAAESGEAAPRFEAPFR